MTLPNIGPREFKCVPLIFKLIDLYSMGIFRGIVALGAMGTILNIVKRVVIDHFAIRFVNQWYIIRKKKED
jgi:hypothetical protein